MSDTLVPEAPSVAAVTEGVLGFRDLLAAASGTDWSRLDSSGRHRTHDPPEHRGP